MRDLELVTVVTDSDPLDNAIQHILEPLEICDRKVNNCEIIGIVPESVSFFVLQNNMYNICIYLIHSLFMGQSYFSCTIHVCRSQ